MATQGMILVSSSLLDALKLHSEWEIQTMDSQSLDIFLKIRAFFNQF